MNGVLVCAELFLWTSSLGLFQVRLEMPRENARSRASDNADVITRDLVDFETADRQVLPPRIRIINST